MAKKAALTIEVYDKRSGTFGFRFVAKNGEKFGHSYNSKQRAITAINRILSSIQNQDFEWADKTKPRRGPRVARRS